MNVQKKSPVIIDLKFDQEEVAAALKDAFAGREVINLVHPASRKRDLSGIDYAVVWKPGADLFSRAKDLKVVFSGGAGVDHVLTLPGLPDVPLVRFVDETLWPQFEAIDRELHGFLHEVTNRVIREALDASTGEADEVAGTPQLGGGEKE